MFIARILIFVIILVIEKHETLPTRTLSTLGEAYSSISRSQSGQQSNVGWFETSYTNINACADR